MFKRILIANRGEIALRIIRCCREMDIETVMVYSTADEKSLPVMLATHSICIGPAKASESYLKEDMIIEAARKMGCDAIHPGYGFLSENAGFARKCEENGIVFIGPSAEIIEKMQKDALAGMPIIGDGVIITPKGEVLSYSSADLYVATAYHNTDPGCTIWTAIGTLCRVGAIAVDPTVIPYGTEMYIVSNDGKYIYGIATAEDCGKSIKGNRIDLYFDTTDECWEFGIRDCTVYFLN